MSRHKSAFCLVVSLLALIMAGCAPGAPDASKARSRAVIESGGIVPVEELRVAEFLNYYEQSFPEPERTAVGLDLRLGNSQLPAGGGEAWLQVGLQARSAESEIIAPLNLALVIDGSGSMDSPEKMPYVKQALRLFLQNLNPDDIVSVVVYNNSAQVILPAQRVSEGYEVAAVIDRLRPAGNTNLHAGLMLGFQEVDRHFDVRRNNRVILLTDGIANAGITDPAQIVADALAYNEKGIYLSSIGLGREFNDALLSQLANQGKGAYHFIDSAEEMDKVFREGAVGLVQKAAGDISLTIRPAPGVRLLGLTGYAGQPPAGDIEIRLRDMGTGDSQVVLAQLAFDARPRGERPLATVELHYTDLFAQRQERSSLPVLAYVDVLSHYDPLRDVEVLRNVTIEEMAEGLKEIAGLYGEGRYQEAWNLAYRIEQDLRRVANLTQEEQMVRDAELLHTYRSTLGRWVEQQTGRQPDMPEPAESFGESEVYDSPFASPAVPVLDIE